MPFEFHPELGPERPRTRTLSVSIALHLLVILLFIVNPHWLDWTDRVVRVEGEDYDQRDATMLTLPPVFPPMRDATPMPAPNRVAPLPPPVVSLEPLSPPVAPEPLPTPMPTPVPPAPTPPPRLTPLPPPPPPSVIRPDDVIADGARPDATPRASRGSTPEPARPGSLSPQPSLPQPAAPPAPPSPPPAAPAAPPSNPRNAGPGNDGLSALAANAGAPHGALPAQIANSNSSALRLPSLGGGRVSGAVDNAIQNAANNRPRSTSSLGRTGTDQGLELPNFSAEEPQILSDTRGYDFGPYLNQVVNRVRVNWYSLIPQSVRYNGQRGRVVLTFTIIKTGEVRELSLRLGSGADPLDRAAMGSITASNPFQQLPSNFDGDHLTLQFTFLYNYSLP